MKYISEYRNRELVTTLVEKIRKLSKTPVNFMEVCGGHTMVIQKFGIPSLLPGHIRLLSGPGCPVCVSSRRFIDHIVALARNQDVIVTTFGDLIRVPGSSSSLDREKANGSDVRIVYSIIEALNIAKQNPDRKVVFPGIGFETTAPASAAGILMAAEEKIKNFYFLSSHKIMPPAMTALIDEGVKIDGYIAPGHVSVITGTGIYTDISKKYNIGFVISGFEPADLLQSIYMLVKQIETKQPGVEIAYRRAVKPTGNEKAKKVMDEVFETTDDWWRGLGVLANSGLKLKEKYSRLDAAIMLPVDVEKTVEPAGCICGLILKGLKQPTECRLFGRICTPQNPVGACMVSSEGACQAFYRYNATL